MNKQSSFIEPYEENSEIDGRPIIQSTFQIFSEGKTYKEINVKLFQKRFTFLIDNHQGTQNYQIQFCFELSFEMVRTCSQQKLEWSLEDVFSIKFHKLKKYIELRNPKDHSHFGIWRDQLRSKLNQKGFHEQFKPIKELGHGNFGSVYQMKNLENKRHYAAKGFSKKEVEAEVNGLASIKKEIQVMRLMDHPNLVKIYGVYETENSIYLILELLAGGLLFDRIHASRKFRSSQVRQIMRSLLHGVEELHNRGFMHRDLKPENILFRDNASNSCVIADFGLAERVDEANPLFLRCGSPGYVAPEIANLKNQIKKYGNSCDIFSLGVVLHILLTGQPPFLGTTCDQALYQNRLCKINFESQIYSKLSSFQLDLLKKMLKKNPEERITAKDALNHQFLTKDIHKREVVQVIQELSEKSDNKRKKVPKVRVKKSSLGEEVQSPILMTKNMSRKHEVLIKEDSCLKFKMGDNTISLQKQETLEFDKPPIYPGKLKKLESRFKNKENHENLCA